MTAEKRKRFGDSITRQIRSTRKQITILFTDIEGSTRYWDTRGDIDGRLMVDYHNRLIFPVIKKFKGKIVKTIGDAIMASFSRSEQAVKAAIAIQQKRMTIAYKFYFKYLDMVAICTGLAGFIWGFINFRLRPV